MLATIRAVEAVGYTFLMSEQALVGAARDPSGAAVRQTARVWSETLCRRAGVVVEVQGGEQVVWSRPMLVMANHQSLLDIPVIFRALPVPFGVLAKKELFALPAFGKAIRALGCVPIDRSDRSAGQESIAHAAERVHAGASLLVFPEGTRSERSGVRELKKGPFYLAEAADVPIVPVGVRGTRAICPKDVFAIRPGRAEVRVGAPIAPLGKGSDARDELRARVRAALVELSGEAARGGR